MTFPTFEQRENIVEEASRRFYRYSRGVRGQTITEKDGLEYWVMVVLYEHLTGEKHDQN